MSYQVSAPLVIIANADHVSGDWYGYQGSIVPEGLNDERCKQLEKEGLLSKTKADPAPDSVEGILAAVGEDKVKAAAALEAEQKGKGRKTLLDGLTAIVGAQA